MIDVRLLRTEFDRVRAAMARRGKPELLEQLSSAAGLDERLREIQHQRDVIRAEVNDLSKQVGAMRRDGSAAGADELQARSRSLGEQEKALADETEAMKQLRTENAAASAGATNLGALLRAKLDQNPADHQARLDLAVALFAAGQQEDAVGELLELYRRDRKWNDEAARKQLLKFFEALGPTNPLTVSGRKRLSSLMFA